MSNISDMVQYFAAFGVTDPEDVAYLQRYPDVTAYLPQLGAETARLHFGLHGQREGRSWGQPAPAAPVDPVAEAAKKAPPALPASYGAANDPAAWGAFMQQARTATEGINRMPGVFSGYDTIPSDKGMVNELFYPAAQQGFRQGIQAAQQPVQNALLMGAPQAIQAMQPVNPLLYREEDE